MEYIVVSYPRKRSVLVDGTKSGDTGETLMITEGTHEIALDGPQNYEPQSRVLVCSATSSVRPRKIEFKPKPEAEKQAPPESAAGGS